ncbi:hypothetical protein U3516DRAFT_895568 [Neocallimastix sp. 'constans']
MKLCHMLKVIILLLLVEKILHLLVSQWEVVILFTLVLLIQNYSVILVPFLQLQVFSQLKENKRD